MNQIIPFEYGGRGVRVHLDGNGNPWFVAKDVCDVIGIANAREAISTLDDDEKSTIRISDGTSPKGGNPNFNIISESGLYTLIIRSNKRQARPFRKWVTSEVLPTIRKTGSYTVEGRGPVGDGVTIGKDRYIELLEVETASLRGESGLGSGGPFVRPGHRVAREHRLIYPQAKRMFEHGFNGREIAETFDGVTYSTVYRWIDRWTGRRSN